MEEKIQYTISIYSENNVGLLNRVSAIFLKRHVNIMSFSTSQSEIKDVIYAKGNVSLSYKGKFLKADNLIYDKSKKKIRTLWVRRKKKIRSSL